MPSLKPGSLAPTTNGLLTPPPIASKQPSQRRQNHLNRQAAIQDIQGQYPGMSKQQARILYQGQKGDIGTGAAANSQIGQINSNFSQPYDYSELPQSPVQGDFNQWRQGQIDSLTQDYERVNAPIFQKEREEFEQRMSITGNPPGSPAYNAGLKQLTDRQDAARQSAQTAAMANAGQNAQQFYNIGMQDKDNAYKYGMAERYQPLQDYNALRASQSPYAMNQLQYNQALGLAQDARTGGFGNIMDYWAAQDDRQRRNDMWQFKNNPQYKQPSPWAQVGGTALGVGGNILADWASSQFWK